MFDNPDLPFQGFDPLLLRSDHPFQFFDALLLRRNGFDRFFESFAQILTCFERLVQLFVFPLQSMPESGILLLDLFQMLDSISRCNFNSFVTDSATA
jgi:hypothetical protein